MPAIRIAAIALIVIGALGLAYGSFGYTRETHHADLGPMHISVAEKERVNVPVWVGIGSIALGAALLLMRGRS